MSQKLTSQVQIQIRTAALVALASLCLSAFTFPQTSALSSEKQTVLWTKLERSILDVDRNLDGVMGVAILDLTDGHKYLLHASDVFPQASSIKICVLAELYRQAQDIAIQDVAWVPLYVQVNPYLVSSNTTGFRCNGISIAPSIGSSSPAPPR